MNNLLKIKINQKRMLKTFFELVRIDSPSGEEQKMVEELFNLLKKEHKLAPKKDKTNNIYAYIPGKAAPSLKASAFARAAADKTAGEGKPILFCLHTDTVEPGRNIKPQIKNGIMNSKGNTILGMDNKAALSIVLEVLHNLRENKLSHPPIELLFTVGEEIGCVGAKAFDYSKIKAKRAFTIDNYDIPIGAITTKSFHYQAIDIKIIGKSAHADNYMIDAAPSGVCALKAVCDALSKINIGRISPYTSLSFGKISGGHARNSVISEIDLQAEIRTLKKSELSKVNRVIKKAFQKTAKKHKIKINIANEFIAPGYNIPKNSQLLKKVKQTFQSLNIQPIEVVGGTDANILNQKGIQTLDLSIGGKNSHQIDEEISIAELKTMAKFLLCFLGVDNPAAKL